MKKVLIKILVAVLVLVIVIAAMVHLFGDRALKVGIETAATKALGVGVTVRNVSLSLLKGTLKLNDLVINNPPGYEHPNLLELGDANIDVGVTSLLGETVIIEEVMLDGVTVVVEQKGLTNNLNTVLESLPADEAQETAPKKDKAPSKNLQIANLEVSNVKVKVKLLPIPGRSDTVELNLAPIKMTNLGTGEKMDTARLTAKILSAIAKGIAQEGAELLPTELVGPIRSTLTDQGTVFVETGKKVLEGSTELGKDVLDKSKDIGENAVDAIKGIFGGNKK
ncbi:MAG: DUF748 domain-containing protein [Planctomycetota bacterium]|jgi:hypothetical protein